MSLLQVVRHSFSNIYTASFNFGQISFSTSVDTETDIEHLTKPFEAGFSISLLKS